MSNRSFDGKESYISQNRGAAEASARQALRQPGRSAQSG
jgi:hypothetical protein